jgi:hypothetical protein
VFDRNTLVHLYYEYIIDNDNVYDAKTGVDDLFVDKTVPQGNTKIVEIIN